MPTGRTSSTSSRTSPFPGARATGTRTEVARAGGALRDHSLPGPGDARRALQLRQHPRTSTSRSIGVVDSALEIDWSNASVGFHCYQTGGTSAPIVAARERYRRHLHGGGRPRLGRWRRKRRADGRRGLADPDAGAAWDQLVCVAGERPRGARAPFPGGFLAAAKRRGYDWIRRLSGTTAPCRHAPRLQRCVLRANGVPGLRRRNAVPYAIALRRSSDGSASGCTVCVDAYVRGRQMAGWTPGLSDVDPLVVLRRRSVARRGAPSSAGRFRRLRAPSARAPDARRARDRERYAISTPGPQRH